MNDVAAERVGEALGLRRVRHDLHERVRPDDAGEVRPGVVRPVVPGGVVTGRVVLELTGAYQGQGLDTVQVVAASRVDIEQRPRVPDRVGKVDVDTAKGIDTVYEAVEVELDEMVDRDAEVVLDSFHEVVRARSRRH